MGNRPVIGITVGDPAGVGPEIVARAMSDPILRAGAKLLVIGGASVMEAALALTHTGLAIHPIEHPSGGNFGSDAVELIDPTDLEFSALIPGITQGPAGRAAFQCIERAIQLAMAGDIHAIATAPLNKEALVASGAPYIDHTAILAAITHCADPLTMFVLDELRIFFLTRHLPLVDACHQVTMERVERYLTRIHGELRRLGIDRPRIAVAGLNPHSGEGGLFGSEEIREIAPAVATAREQGIDVSGPIPADSVFYLCRTGRFDAVLSLYHDQGHIAVKTVDFERTVSVTLGLPFLRTSVDHGTAFDIAWKGSASAVSMREAIGVAVRYGFAYPGLSGGTAPGC